MVKMIVCMKQVPMASELPWDAKTGTLPRDLADGMMNPACKNALEAALRLKDADGSRVTAVSLGAGLSRDVVKKALSMGADELILLEDEAFGGGDSWSTALALAAAIKKIGEYDLILCGRQAADWDAGQTGCGIAELLRLPAVTVARKIELSGTNIRVERATDDGYEVIETTLPAVVTVSNEIGEPRYPTIRGIMAAKKREPVIWKPADIGLEKAGESGRKSTIARLTKPQRNVECRFIEGETPEEAAINLAVILRQEKLI
jgi:electron transfer flavoprotein beta subunit